MAIEINVVNGIVNISTDGEVPRSYYGAVGASGSVMPMKAHLLGNVTELSWVSAQEYSIGTGIPVFTLQDSSSGLGTGLEAAIVFTDSATPGMTYISSVSISGIQNGKYKIGDSVNFTISGQPVTLTVKSLAYERVLIKIGGDFYEENWYDLVINGTSPTDFSDALSLLSSAFASVGSPYKVYSALLTQTGTDDPIPTVLQNTLGGDITWSYNNIGVYFGTLNGAFLQNKYFSLMPSSGYDSQVNQGGGGNPYSYFRFSDDQIVLSSGADDQLLNSPIEIRVYN